MMSSSVGNSQLPFKVLPPLPVPGVAVGAAGVVIILCHFGMYLEVQPGRGALT